MIDVLWAIVLIALTVYLATLSRPARADRGCLWLSLALLAGLHLLGFVNAVVAPLPGGEMDARYFADSTRTALGLGNVPRIDMGAFGYKLILYGYGWLVSDAPFMLQLTSILAASASISLITAMTARLSGSHVAARAVLVLLCLSPGFLLYSVLTLREAFELVSIAGFLALYCCTRRPVVLLAGPLVLFPAAFMHQALLVHAAFMWSVAMLVSLWGATPERFRWWVPLAVAGTLVVVISAALFYPLVGGHSLVKLVQIGLLEELQEYRAPIEAARPSTSFGIELSFATPLAAAGSLLLNYVYFLFGPLINFRPSVEYLVLAWEALVRALGLAALVLVAWRGGHRRQWWFLALVYVSMTFLWSIATTNDGQAFRHHYLTQWILFLAIAAAWRLRPRVPAPGTGRGAGGVAPWEAGP